MLFATTVSTLLAISTPVISAAGTSTAVAVVLLTTSEAVLDTFVTRSPYWMYGGLTPAGSVLIMTRTPMNPGYSGVAHWSVQSFWFLRAEMADGGPMDAARPVW